MRVEWTEMEYKVVLLRNMHSRLSDFLPEEELLCRVFMHRLCFDSIQFQVALFKRVVSGNWSMTRYCMRRMSAELSSAAYPAPTHRGHSSWCCHPGEKHFHNAWHHGGNSWVSYIYIYTLWIHMPFHILSFWFIGFGLASNLKWFL